MVHDTMWRKLLNVLPHGYNMAEEDWQRRHRLMLWVLGLHVPALVALGLVLDYAPRTLVYVVITPVAAVMLAYMLRRQRRTASVIVTAGLVYCSAALVGLTHGTIEAHFHFFIIIGFIALYQDWAPLLFNIVFTVISHGIGSAWQQTLIFDHLAGQADPWLWSAIHGVAVLMACAGVIVFWRFTEESQRDKDMLARRLADSEINRRQFTSDLLTNLARRNQSLLHRQLEIINQMEESERDPDALSDLFALDHIATRVRRNAESLLVLSGEQPPRTWSEPVPLRDVLRAAIAETENLERVVFVVDEQSAVVGHTVTDLTHLLAELTENAVRFSPPDATVTVRSRPDRARPGGRLITIEDWGVGMPAEQIEEANHLLAAPPDVDLSVSQRLGFHVVARLAARHGIKVVLSVTPGSGTTALVTLPPSLFSPLHSAVAAVTSTTTTTTTATAGLVTAGAAASAAPARAVADKRAATQANTPAEHRPAPEAPRRAADQVDWSGWWDPAVASAMPAFNPAPANSFDPTINGFDLVANGFDPAASGVSSAASGVSSAASGVSSAANGVGVSPTANGFDPAANGVSSATNGFGPTPYGLGPTPNGLDPAVNGLGREGTANGSGRDVGWLEPAADGREPGAERTGTARDANGLGANGSGQAPLGTDLNGDANSPTTLGAGWPAVTDGPVGHGSTAANGLAERIDPEGAEGLSTPTYRASTSPISASGPLPASTKPSPTPRPLIVDAQPVPTGAVPSPRTSAPVDPVSGLRRRIPQAHLSAELRTPEVEPAEPVVDRRSTVDAAAALSRYQASRAAAQAAVGDNRPGDTPFDSDNTTDDAVNGGRA